MTLTRGRALFLTLQLLDLITTLLCFRLGGYEANPATALLMRHLGAPGGLLTAKAATVGMMLPVKKLLWVANLFYLAIVGWNILVLALLWGAK